MRGLLSLCVAAFVIGAFPARAETWTPELFDRWIDARVGNGQPVYWYSVGTLKSYPDGKTLARVEGYDTARMHQPDSDIPLVHQYNRKIYVYRDPETNQILRQADGKDVEPVAYPYQFITYERKGGELETFVEQGSGKRVNRIGPGRDITVRMLGDTTVFTAPIYLDFPVGPNSRYQAFENYDFFVQPKGSIQKPYQLSWVRYGDAPPWAGGGKSIMHLITWRIDRFDDVPESLRKYILAEAPLWQAPPHDLSEIRKMQKSDNASSDSALRLAKFMTGRFASGPAEDGHRVADFRTPIAKLGKGEWIYFQRNQGKNIADQKTAYRQRVLQLLDRPDGKVVQQTWSLLEPERFATAPSNSDVLQSLALENLKPTMEQGCDQLWSLTKRTEPNLDKNEMMWLGSVDPKKCTIFSKRRNKRIAIGSQSRLTADKLEDAERGFDLDGTQLWGTPPDQYTAMTRLIGEN